MVPRFYRVHSSRDYHSTTQGKSPSRLELKNKFKDYDLMLLSSHNSFYLI